MATLEDIQRLVMNYGNDILDDERRAHAIICDWHPHETVSSDEVSRLCEQWKKGKRPSVIYIYDDDPYPFFEGRFPLSMAQSLGADSLLSQAMQGSVKAGKVKKSVTGKAKTQSATKKVGASKKVDAKSSAKQKTKKKNSIVLSANGNSISIDGDNISVKQTFKSGVSTKTISIHIDTTQSFRAN